MLRSFEGIWKNGRWWLRERNAPNKVGENAHSFVLESVPIVRSQKGGRGTDVVRTRNRLFWETSFPSGDSDMNEQKNITWSLTFRVFITDWDTMVGFLLGAGVDKCRGSSRFWLSSEQQWFGLSKYKQETGLQQRPHGMSICPEQNQWMIRCHMHVWIFSNRFRGSGNFPELQVNQPWALEGLVHDWVLWQESGYQIKESNQTHTFAVHSIVPFHHQTKLENVTA